MDSIASLGFWVNHAIRRNEPVSWTYGFAVIVGNIEFQRSDFREIKSSSNSATIPREQRKNKAKKKEIIFDERLGVTFGESISEGDI